MPVFAKHSVLRKLRKKLSLNRKSHLKKSTFAFKLVKTSIPLTQSLILSLNGTHKSEMYLKTDHLLTFQSEFEK